MGSILAWTGLIFYIINYAIGWALNLKRRPVSKLTHQVVYTLLVINVIFALLLAEMTWMGFSFAGFSLVMLIILPFGKKGSLYHKAVSTFGLILYLLFIMS